MPTKKLKKQKLDIAKSNFEFLHKEFDDIIVYMENYDQSGQASQCGIARKEFIFKDDSFLSITEHYTKDGYISYYNYDWYTKDEKIIKFYHSEPHYDKKYQTETELFHTHRVDFSNTEIREPNYAAKDLYGILEEIANELNKK